jgi:hypothetical protein
MRTIFIRHRPSAACFSVVIKGGMSISGANNLHIASHAEAVTYANELHERHGFPVEDETPAEVR